MKEFDVVVIGAGPAGLACSNILSKQGISCLVLEQKDSVGGKVCGDGLTVRAIRDLLSIGVDPTMLPGKKVYRKIVVRDGVQTSETFADKFGHEYEYGVSRDVLDRYLLGTALKNGTSIKYNCNCNSINKIHDKYIINGKFVCKRVILACGAVGGAKLGGLDQPADLPVGVSARIWGKCDLADDAFHYYYDKRIGRGYAWIFPVGENLWNLGVWSSDKKNLKELYQFFEHYIFKDRKIKYDRAPRGACIGASQNRGLLGESMLTCIGDCAYSSNYSSGEGISYAIEDGIRIAGAVMKQIERDGQLIHPETMVVAV